MTTTARQRAGEAPDRLVEDTIGTTVDVAVVDPDSLERSVGELERLVDRRG